ncbi:MAG: hypothetical protein R6U98_00370, partial [Pirellulaceae bacterium]
RYGERSHPPRELVANPVLTNCPQMPRACPVVVHARRYKPAGHTTPVGSVKRNQPRDKPVASKRALRVQAA